MWTENLEQKVTSKDDPIEVGVQCLDEMFTKYGKEVELQREMPRVNWLQKELKKTEYDVNFHICEPKLSAIFGKSDEGISSDDIMRCLDSSN